LTNKDNIWQSNHKWDFEKYGKLIYIKDISSNTVLESKTNGSVVARNISDGKPSQLWDKGKANAEGYFTLKNSEKILTANFAGKLEIKGKPHCSKVKSY
jgi:hypothetical protein